MPGEFNIQRLSDEFGQFTLQLQCSACGHERNAEPQRSTWGCPYDRKITAMRLSDTGALGAVDEK
jgi:hypothetical protein